MSMNPNGSGKTDGRANLDLARDLQQVQLKPVDQVSSDRRMPRLDGFADRSRPVNTRPSHPPLPAALEAAAVPRTDDRWERFWQRMTVELANPGPEAIPSPIDVGAWPLREHKDDYLLGSGG